MLTLFRESGLPKPACYCVDSYDYAYLALSGVGRVLRDIGEITKPVYIQETNYNDARTYADIKRAVAETELNFHGIFQWPKLRGREPQDFPDVFPKRYDNFLVEL